MADSFSRRKNPFTIVSNSVAQNDNLTYEAKGVMLQAMSLPANWVFHKKWFLAHASKCGRDKLDRIFKELQDNGHLLKMSKVHKETKKFMGVYWFFSDEKDKFDDLIESALRLKDGETEESREWILQEYSKGGKAPQTNDTKGSNGTLKTRIPGNTESGKPASTKKYIYKETSSSKPEPAQAEVKPSFEFDLVLAWLITQLEKLGNYLSDSDLVFVEASLQDYVDQAKRPTKATAYSWVEQALTNRFNVMQRSHQSSEARNRRTKALVAVIDAASANMANKAEATKPKTTAEKLADTSWADDDFLEDMLND